jgi:DNA-binding LytR/AlgR family response regulator
MLNNPTAVIAEDEPLLAQALQAELSQLWPELEIIGIANNGLDAKRLICDLSPDCAFLDIQMPTMSGIEAAAASIEDAAAEKLPLFVFVTAFDEYATKAFEQAAVDYILKPVTSLRLSKTIHRLKIALAQKAGVGAQDPNAAIDLLATQMRQIMAHSKSSPYLQTVTASIGDVIRMIPVEEIVFFEASDKYIRVVTNGAEALIREPLKMLLTKINPNNFVQIHRSTVVNRAAISHLVRDPDASGKLALHLKGSKEVLTVSRLYAGLFKPM